MESGRTLQERSRLRASEELCGPRRGNLRTADQLGSRDGLFHCDADYVLLTMLKIKAEVLLSFLVTLGIKLFRLSVSVVLVWTRVFIAAFVCDTNVVSVLRLPLARVINDGDAGTSHQPAAAFVFLVGAVMSFSREAELPQPVRAS